MNTLFAALLSQTTAAQFTVNNGQKNVGVQLFQWNFNDIANECVNFLGPNGYAWVQTSPVAAHAGNAFDSQTFPWYLAYQPLAYKIGNRLGNEGDFAKMVQTCKNAGVDVVVDVVLNHNAYVNQQDTWGFGLTQGWSTADFNENLPDAGLTKDNYHDNICDDNVGTSAHPYTDFNQQNCRAGRLVDIATEQPAVRQKIANYLNSLLAYGVVGFRTDLATYIPSNDWRAIQSLLNKNYKGNVPYFGQEAYPMPSSNNFQDYTQIGRVINVNGYTMPVGKAFRNIGTSVDQLGNILQNQARPLANEAVSVTFIENHDQVRNTDGQNYLPLSRLDINLYYQAIAFNILYPYGLAQVHSDYYFQWNGGTDANRESPISAPYNSTGYILPISANPSKWFQQHRLPAVYSLVRVRNYIGSTPPSAITNNGLGSNQIYWNIPGKAFVAINSARGSENLNMNNVVSTGLPAGVYCNMVYAYSSNGTCKLWHGTLINSDQISYIVDASGNTQLNIRSSDLNKVVVLYSGNDGYLKNIPPPTTSTTTGSTGPTSTPVTNSVPVTFKVTHDSGFGDSVYVVGTFNNWNTCAAVTCNWSSGNVWNCPTTLTNGVSYQWKAIQFGTATGTTCSNPKWSPGSNSNILAASGTVATLSY
ncbi:hypothetical protein HDV06_000244 [Boothiomyces sp. JEL0866]|nr:hypothetical protein HDV06_000244 [Boothiomyces sp. JEL0866]